MKIFLLSMCFVTTFQISKGQTNTFPFPENGPVGIGTANPITKLQVYSTSRQGEVRIGGGNGTGEGRIFIQADMLNNQSYIDAFGDNVFKKLSIEALPLLLNPNSKGKVGIGTSAPFSTLHVKNDLNTGTIALGNDEYPGLITSSASSGEFRIDNRSSAGGYISFFPNGQGMAVGSEAMRISKTGDVGIGTTDPKGYKLAVAGNMIAEQITVKLQGSWPDYVFRKNYTLTPLSEVKRYIDQNHHLCDVPSEQQVQKGGLDLGEMNAKLLEKIEELTLYMLEKRAAANSAKKDQSRSGSKIISG
jgi:hypothetical protein